MTVMYTRRRAFGLDSNLNTAYATQVILVLNHPLCSILQTQAQHHIDNVKGKVGKLGRLTLVAPCRIRRISSGATVML